MDVFLLAFLCRCTFLSKSFIINMAEGVGFEPTDPCGSPVFKTGAIDHSAIPPISASRLDHLPRWPQRSTESESVAILFALVGPVMILRRAMQALCRALFARKDKNRKHDADSHAFQAPFPK